MIRFTNCLAACLTALLLTASLPAAAEVEVLHSFTVSSEGHSPRGELVRAPDGSLFGVTPKGGLYDHGTIFRISVAGQYSTISSFGNNVGDPDGGLTLGVDGKLYGTVTFFNGMSGQGAVYRINVDGSGFQIVRDFSDQGLTTVGGPAGTLVRDASGRIYGTTPYGGINNAGSIYRINTNGSLTRLFSFSGTGGVAYGLQLGPDGRLYGVTRYVPGSGHNGSVFVINMDGTGFTYLVGFGTYSNGQGPNVPLAFGDDGLLYGTTSSGGYGSGVMFRVNTNGSGFAVLRAFDSTGCVPQSGLTRGVGGVFYGTTSACGSYYGGTVYSVNSDGTGFTVLREFDYQQRAAGVAPWSPLTFGLDGKLYGAASAGGQTDDGAVFSLDTAGAGFSVVHSFLSSKGKWPNGSLVVTPAGNLLGTTSAGGKNDRGTVFSLPKTGGALNTLKQFGDTNSDERAPITGLTAGLDETYFGTTTLNQGYSGSAFFLKEDGSGYGARYFFPSYPAYTEPTSQLVAGPDGALFGTTFQGGSQGYGTLYKLNAGFYGQAWVKDLAFQFRNPAGLVLHPNGYLYGISYQGGANGRGMIFRIDQTGNNLGQLFSFDNSTGSPPNHFTGRLVVGTDSRLYGLTYTGLFAINADGSGFTMLHTFDSPLEGQGLMLGLDGRLFGTNRDVYGTGSIYTINQDGSGFEFLHQFNGQDGNTPAGELVSDAEGKLYGAAAYGGADNRGVIFRLKLRPRAPMGVAVVAGNDQLALSWDAVPGAGSYNVYMGTSADGEAGAPVRSLAGASTTFSGLTAGVTYFFKVRAVNGDGSSPDSAEVSATYFNTPPSVNLVLSPAAVFTGNSASLSWTSDAATTCTAAGAWSGSKPLSGSLAVSPAAGTYTYTLTCVGPGGSVSDSETLTVTDPDITPAAFNFGALYNVARSSLQTSSEITIADINTPSPVSVVNGTYSKNGALFTSAAGTVVAGDRLRVQHVSAAGFGTTVTTTLTVGANGVLAGVSGRYSSTTLAEDHTPNAFHFTDAEVLVPGSQVTSNVITISGINTATRVSVSGGEFKIVGVTQWQTAAANVSNGQRVQVRHTASLLPTGKVDTVLNIGGVTDTFTSTVVPDLTPDDFHFTDVTGAARNATVTSKPVQLKGFTGAATVQVTGGDYRINSGSWTTNPGVARPGDAVRVRHVSGAAAGAVRNTTLTVGGVSDTFSSTTR